MSTAVEGVLRDAMAHELGWDRITVSEQEARQEYDAHPELYHTPDRLHLQHIYLRAEKETMAPAEREKVRERLEAIRREILGGAEFSAMAQKYSQSATADSGGWMALSAGADVFPAFAQEVWALKVGEVSDVIDTPTGFQLVKLKERLPGADRPYETVRDFAVKHERADKLAAAQDQFLAEAGARHGLIRRYDRLEDPTIGDDEALVEVGGFRLTFDALRDQLPDAYEIQLYNGYFPKVHEYLDQAARNRLLLLEAERLHLAERPEVAAKVDAARLAARADFAREKRLNAKAAAVPETELRDFFRLNERRYQTLKTIDLSVILLKQKQGEPLWTTLKRGEELVRRIRAGEDFATLARKYSSHYSAPDGGLLKDLTDYGVGRLVQSRARFRRALGRLSVGEVSDAMVAQVYDPQHLSFIPTGVILARLDKVTPPHQQTFEAVAGLVRDNYLRRNYQQLADAVRKDVLAGADLRVLADRLPPL